MEDGVGNLGVVIGGVIMATFLATGWRAACREPGDMQNPIGLR